MKFKMTEEFNLSKYRMVIPSFEKWCYTEDDVKEFIKRLKEKKRPYKRQNIIDAYWIDKLAGEKLI